MVMKLSFTPRGSAVRARHCPSASTLGKRGFPDGEESSVQHSGTAPTVHDHISRTLFAACIAIIVLLLFATTRTPHANASPIYEPDWWSGQASWYAATGNHTSCGKSMEDRTAWFVAALKSAAYSCGRPITICNRHHCVNVRVQDRGKWRDDPRDPRIWDLTARVRAALKCPALCKVKWHSGWTK